MRVCVCGLWHLGAVTAACLADGGHDVTGIDTDPRVVDGLMMGTPPVFEPGLEDILTLRGIASGRIRFTRDATAVFRRRCRVDDGRHAGRRERQSRCGIDRDGNNRALSSHCRTARW